MPRANSPVRVKHPAPEAPKPPIPFEPQRRAPRLPLFTREFVASNLDQAVDVLNRCFYAMLDLEVAAAKP